jgi:hypothetical protein
MFVASKKIQEETTTQEDTTDILKSDSMNLDERAAADATP